MYSSVKYVRVCAFKKGACVLICMDPFVLLHLKRHSGRVNTVNYKCRLHVRRVNAVYVCVCEMTM